MINIILNGCGGKMGKTVSNAVKAYPNLYIAAGIDKYMPDESGYPVFESINSVNIKGDILLDFSRPDSLVNLLSYSKKNKIPLILCTTGYSKEEIKLIEESSNEIAIFRSANMSIGINVINNVLKKISNMLYNDFDIEIIEKHHNQKVDSPSGTALLLGDTIRSSIKEETEYIYGRQGTQKRQHKDIGIHAIRGGSIVGEHEVIFAGQGELIELKHTAMSRDVFAIGALKACAFMFEKEKGLYDMNDVIESLTK